MATPFIDNDTITAIATPPGTGGIAVIRVSGPQAIEIVSGIWRGADLAKSERNKSRYGVLYNPETGEAIDEALATPFRSPASFTGEDTVELAVHGSVWIQREVLRLLIDHGARVADRGEFTQRAFLNGKLDLAQAEGIADLIASSSRAAHRLALTQTRGGFSKRLEELRTKLIEFASLLELELDFSEEDVEFADRSQLSKLADEILAVIKSLTSSYANGKAIKEGVPVVIAGIPNAGKSTLLNKLLDDNKAIVTEIPGTTRDIIEDTTEIGGILFRFIDTAGLRETTDIVERMGIERTRESIGRAAIVINLIDSTRSLEEQTAQLAIPTDAAVITVLNKTDIESPERPLHIEATKQSTATNPQYKKNALKKFEEKKPEIRISASTGEGLELLKEKLIKIASPNTEADMTVTNARHYESLLHASRALTQARDALKSGLTADFIAQDVREALHHLGTITGAITTPDLLHSIFSRFCIGK